MLRIRTRKFWCFGVGALAVPLGLALLSAAKAEERPTNASRGYGACTRCYCDGFQSGGGNACSRWSCRHQYGDHKS